MDKVVSSMHMGLIKMGMIRKKYSEFRHFDLRLIGIPDDKPPAYKLNQFTDYYEEKRHKSLRSFTSNQLAIFFDHYKDLEGSNASKYSIFSDGEGLYGLAGFNDDANSEPKLYILGKGTMTEHPHPIITLPDTQYLVRLWYVDLQGFFQGAGTKPNEVLRSDLKLNPDIYKHCVTQRDFKAFIQRASMLEMLKI